MISSVVQGFKFFLLSFCIIGLFNQIAGTVTVEQNAKTNSLVHNYSAFILNVHQLEPIKKQKRW